jgi:hypothetical protein
LTARSKVLACSWWLSEFTWVMIFCATGVQMVQLVFSKSIIIVACTCSTVLWWCKEQILTSVWIWWCR